jgi:hypothetical protein
MLCARPIRCRWIVMSAVVVVAAVAVPILVVVQLAQHDILELQRQRGREGAFVRFGKPDHTLWGGGLTGGIIARHPRPGKPLVRLAFVVYDKNGTPFGRVQWGLLERKVVREVYWAVP